MLCIWLLGTSLVRRVKTPKHASRFMSEGYKLWLISCFEPSWQEWPGMNLRVLVKASFQTISNDNRPSLRLPKLTDRQR